MVSRRRALAGVAVWLTMMAAGAAGQEQAPPMREGARKQLEEAQARLKLTDDQRTKVEPILRAGIERRLAILKQHGLVDENGQRTGTKPKPRQMRGIRDELQDVQKDVASQLSAVLTPEQMTEYRKLQDEKRDELRERARNRR